MKALWLLPDLAATESLGRALALTCPWGAGPRMLYLTGELGAGKTTLAAAAIGALGVKESVRSPTYALVEVYQVAAVQAVHVDLYRLQGASELEQLGLRDFLTAGTLFLIEWPERAGAALPGPDIAVRLEAASERRATLESYTLLGEQWLAATLARPSTQVGS